MTDRSCGWCGADIARMKSTARYCSTQHKKAAGAKRHRERNPGYYAKYTNSPTRIAYRQAHVEELRAYARQQARAYRLANPEAARAWWAANTEKHRLYQANLRARRVHAADYVVVTEADWLRIVAYHRGRCSYCGTRPDALEIDHVIPLSRGGRHGIGNIVPACRSCNRSKGSLLVMEWRRAQPPAA